MYLSENYKYKIKRKIKEKRTLWNIKQVGLNLITNISNYLVTKTRTYLVLIITRICSISSTYSNKSTCDLILDRINTSTVSNRSTVSNTSNINFFIRFIILKLTKHFEFIFLISANYFQWKFASFLMETSCFQKFKPVEESQRASKSYHNKPISLKTASRVINIVI